VTVSLTVGGAARVPTSKCRSCSASIFWARSPADRVMPVDAQPAADGLYVLVAIEPPTLAKFDAADPQHAGNPRFNSHFATCDQPSKWSKRRKR
jgi:hypothetical protein